jgi:serine/threonine-protein phosphatase PP1 catalytic subunit
LCAREDNAEASAARMTERTTQSQVNGDVVEKNLPLPEVLQLILTAESIPDTEPTILQLDGQFCVVGDIHGNIQDLLRIIDIGGYPADTQHLFLGDYIDRGKNSSAVILLLYAQLKSISFEFSQMGRQYGFLAESRRCKLIEPYQKILTSFAKMPLAAIVGEIFCVHGGISLALDSKDDILQLAKPGDGFPLQRQICLGAIPIRR